MSIGFIFINSFGIPSLSVYTDLVGCSLSFLWTYLVVRLYLHGLILVVRLYLNDLAIVWVFDFIFMDLFCCLSLYACTWTCFGVAFIYMDMFLFWPLSSWTCLGVRLHLHGHNLVLDYMDLFGFCH